MASLVFILASQPLDVWSALWLAEELCCNNSRIAAITASGCSRELLWPAPEIFTWREPRIPAIRLFEFVGGWAVSSSPVIISVGQRIAASSLARNSRRFITADNDLAMLRGRARSFPVHCSSMGRRSALIRVVLPKSSFTAIGVNGAGLKTFTIWARKAY